MPPLGKLSGKFHIRFHVAVHIAFFFIFDRDQVSEILAVQFSHDFGNLRDPFSQQHIDFAAGSLNVFKVHQFQART